MKSKDLNTQRDHLRTLLRQIRLEKGIRQQDLATKLHQYQSFISKYESGERRLDLIEIKQVCRALGISLPEFIKKFEDSLQ